MFIYIGILSLYDDDYGRVHYDDDNDHILNDIRGLCCTSRRLLQPTSLTMMGLGGVRVAWWAHTRTCGSCVGKYYTSNSFGVDVTSMMVLNDRSLIMIACIYIPEPQ